MKFRECVGRIPVSRNERARCQPERCEPARVANVEPKRRGPDRALVAQNVLEELPFERRSRRRRRRWRRAGRRYLSVRAGSSQENYGAKNDAKAAIRWLVTSHASTPRS